MTSTSSAARRASAARPSSRRQGSEASGATRTPRARRAFTPPSAVRGRPAPPRSRRAAARPGGRWTLVLSGYRQGEMRALPGGDAVRAQLDGLVDGNYVAAERRGRGLRGRANQRIWLLTERYTLAEIERTPEAEIRIAR